MQIRHMTTDDIPLGMCLKAQAGWNQLEADWRRQLALEPDGGFVAEIDGQGVGTACFCTFGNVAWISLVLVDRAHRGRGIGTALMRHVVQQLDDRGVATIRLDATALGQPIYEKLGFVGDFTLARHEGILPSAGSEGIDFVEPLTPLDLPAVCELDARVTKTQRAKLLRHLFESNPQAMRKFMAPGGLDGFAMCRPGANAWQLGPIQGTLPAGCALLLDAARRFAGQRVFVDVPVDHAQAIAVVQSLGLTVQRTFLRMSRGPRFQEDLNLFWSSFGPSKG